MALLQEQRPQHIMSFRQRAIQSPQEQEQQHHHQHQEQQSCSPAVVGVDPDGSSKKRLSPVVDVNLLSTVTRRRQGNIRFLRSNPRTTGGGGGSSWLVTCLLWFALGAVAMNGLTLWKVGSLVLWNVNGSMEADRGNYNRIIHFPEPNGKTYSGTTTAKTTTATTNRLGKPPQSSLSSQELESDINNNNNNKNHRFLVFYGSTSDGQGAGNILQGFLAAQLLGLEYHRTVCIVWPEFQQAFEYVDAEHARLCHGAEQWNVSRQNQLQLWNFLSSHVDECHLDEVLSLSSDDDVVGLTGNTYPGWRSEIPPNFFHTYYKPRTALREYLSKSNPNQQEPPSVVVHLRAPDGPSDVRRGLNEQALDLLGRKLYGNSTYFVTNRPDWYNKFHKSYQWSYDTYWQERQKPIVHAAMDLVWWPNGTKTNRLRGNSTTSSSRTTSRRTMAKNQATTSTTSTTTEQDDDSQEWEHNIKLWADWYRLLTAPVVYHTNSDFSKSAIHWHGSSSSVQGYELQGLGRLPNKAKAQQAQPQPQNNNNSNTRRDIVLKLQPTYFNKKHQRIPPLVERKSPHGVVRDDDDCQYKRFCYSHAMHQTNKKTNHDSKNAAPKEPTAVSSGGQQDQGQARLAQQIDTLLGQLQQQQHSKPLPPQHSQ